MSKPNDSALERLFPLLVWDSSPEQRILLKTFFWRCSKSQIEAQPLINSLSTLSANLLVARLNLVSLEPKLFSIPDACQRATALKEIQDATSSICSANLIFEECSRLYREVEKERS